MKINILPLEVKKQAQENPQGIVRRFTKRLRRSGVLHRARKNRFRTKDKSPALKKKSALRREQLKHEYEELKKNAKPS